MIGQNASSIFKKESCYFFFDFHSNDHTGIIVSDGTSSLLIFKSAQEVQKYVKYLSDHLCTMACPIIEVLPVLITCVNNVSQQDTTLPVTQNSLEKYFTDQHQKKCLKRKQQQNSDQNICNQETRKKKRRQYAQNIRSMPHYRKKEMLKKKRKRLEEKQVPNVSNVSALDLVIHKFETSIAEGPIYVCTCCEQTWFRKSVTKASSLNICDKVHKKNVLGESCPLIGKNGCALVADIILKKDMFQSYQLLMACVSLLIQKNSISVLLKKGL